MAAARRRAISGGGLLVFGGGLALYQMTSLVLGPAAQSRQLHLSITVPSVDLGDLSEPVIANVNLVSGTLAAPAAPPVASTPVPNHAITKIGTVSKASPAPTTPTAAPTAAPTTRALPPGLKPLPPGVAVVATG